MIFSSIKTRMTLAACVLVALLLTATAVFTLTYFHKEFTSSIADQQFTLLTSIAKEIDDKLARAQAMLVAEAASLPAEALTDADKAQAFLDNRRGLLSNFDNGLCLFSPSGELIAESPFLPKRRGLNFSFREYFQTTVKTGRAHISVPYRSSKHQHPVIMLTAPLFTPDGELRGILTGGLDLLKPNVLGELSQVKVGQTGYLYIYGRDRTMIIHPDPKRILQQDVPVGANRLFDLAVEGFEGTGETVNSRGLHALASFKHLESVPWILAANYPVAEAYAPILRAQHFFLAAILLGALLSMVLAWLMMKRLTRPLLHLTNHVEKMAELAGEDKLFPYHGRDEIGTLARTFNRMVTETEKQTEALRYLGSHDALTSLYNRRYFEDEMERLIRGRQAPISVIIADVDGLKRVNDSLGHAAGDDLIRSAADVFAGAFRSEDIVARIGGDEFAALLPGAGLREAEEALVRIRRRQTEAGVPGGLTISLALGCAAAESPTELAAALRQADEHMYRDKKGRNGEN